VRKLRKAAKLTLETAAERAQLSGNYWGEVERSTKVPSLDTMVAMAKALDVPIDVLLHLDREEDEKNLRKTMEALLDGCTSEQLELAHRVVKAVLER
jgi:transcriptional regulator with XRE-family HTH domain